MAINPTQQNFIWFFKEWFAVSKQQIRTKKLNWNLNLWLNEVNENITIACIDWWKKIMLFPSMLFFRIQYNQVKTVFKIPFSSNMNITIHALLAKEWNDFNSSEKRWFCDSLKIKNKHLLWEGPTGNYFGSRS